MQGSSHVKKHNEQERQCMRLKSIIKLASADWPPLTTSHTRATVWLDDSWNHPPQHVDGGARGEFKLNSCGHARPDSGLHHAFYSHLPFHGASALHALLCNPSYTVAGEDEVICYRLQGSIKPSTPCASTVSDS